MRVRRVLTTMVVTSLLVGAAASPAASGAASDSAKATSGATSSIPAFDYYFDRTGAVGWHDASGDHAVTVREAYAADYAWLNGYRDDPLAWPGTAGTGANPVALAASDTGLLVVAVSGTVDAECDASHDGLEPCHQLWITRFGPGQPTDGARVEITTPEVPLRGLNDGSMLTRTSGDVIWRAPDGTVRAHVATSSDDVEGAQVDALGRLLVAHADGKVHRWTTAGVNDLTVDEDCDPAGGFTVGVDADGGFASACGTVAAPLTTHLVRYDSSGTVAWDLTTAAEPNGVHHPYQVAIDSTGRVWVDGTAPLGQEVRAYRSTGGTTDPLEMSHDLGVLRAVGDRVFITSNDPPYVDPYTLWHPGNGTSSSYLPSTAQPTTCSPSSLTVTGAGARSGTVTIAGCTAHDPVDGEYDPTEYLVEALDPAGDIVGSTVVPAGAGPLTGSVTDLPAGVKYRFQVRARNAAGNGPKVVLSKTMTPPFVDLKAFATRQLTDLGGRAPTAQERDNLVTGLEFGATTPAGAVDSLLNRPWSGPSVDPVTRLYRAYFGRNPDRSGLAYWVGKRRNGQTLIRASNVFAHSSEFLRTYGPLDDEAFVQLVYRNVLDRDGDAAGVAYWTKRLRTGASSRGQVMVNFSESTEYIAKAKPTVDVVAVTFGLLGRPPTAAEAATWIPALASGAPRTALISEVLGTEAYAQRVAP